MKVFLYFFDSFWLYFLRVDQNNNSYNYRFYCTIIINYFRIKQQLAERLVGGPNNNTTNGPPRSPRILPQCLISHRVPQTPCSWDILDYRSMSLSRTKMTGQQRLTNRETRMRLASEKLLKLNWVLLQVTETFEKNCSVNSFTTNIILKMKLHRMSSGTTNFKTLPLKTNLFRSITRKQIFLIWKV